MPTTEIDVAPGTRSFSKAPHILLIDDELSICTGIQGILEMDGYRAAYAITYQDGFEYIDKNPDLDIVLLDVNLRSDLSGIEVLPLIKEKNKYIQVIMFTSYDRLDVGLECMKKGATDFMTKPFDEKHFLRAVPIALEKKKLEQIKDLYFDMVVHDLKNPLQCIYGAFEMLHDQIKDSLTPLQERLFETAEGGISQIQMIIGNILGITRFEKGSLTARRESFSLKETVAEVVRQQQNVQMILPDCLPDAVRSDRDLFSRVLTNIISNALRFALVGSTVRVVCSYDPSEQLLTTSVTNEGSYIPEQHREAVFNKFIGVQRSIGSLRGQNFGLGLTFSKMAVEALEGSIWVDSEKDENRTTFSFSIKDFSVF
ncbi:MAG: hybrid sensor histidine kinase/response regulator [Chitinispirillaceae bacterium]|nr:hybrid sensor histidine kinase/response regulator [Chitinispirillaceae bacterium]